MENKRITEEELKKMLSRKRRNWSILFSLGFILGIALGLFF